MNGKVRAAAIAIAEKIRRGEIAVTDNEIIGDDLESYILDTIEGKLARDAKRLRTLIRDGQRGSSAASTQLTLPGMEHASLPACVIVPNGKGSDLIIPVRLATIAQIRREVRKTRKLVEVQSHIVAAWEATLDHLESLGVPDDKSGGFVLDNFGKAVEA